MEPIIPPNSTPGLQQPGVPAKTPAPEIAKGVSFADLVAQATPSKETPSAPTETDMLTAAQGLEQMLAANQLTLHFAAGATGKPSIELLNSETGAVVARPQAGEVITALNEQSLDGLL